MEMLNLRLLMASAALAAFACTDDDPLWTEPPCGVSGQQTCGLAEGGLGTRWCTADGLWSQCRPTNDGRRVREDDVPIEPPGQHGGPPAPPPIASGSCTGSALGFRPQDVEYSGALDRVVAVSTSPNLLTLLDPVSGASREVPLPLAPAAVSVAPDGRTAAVAHDAFVSVVDLVSATLTATIPTTSDASDVVLAADGFAYVFPRTDQWVEVHAVDIAGRREVPSSTRHSIYDDMRARLHPGGTAIYGITRGLSPTDIERIDVAGGAVRGTKDSPYHGDFPMCEDLWFTETGDRLFNACGTVFRASPMGADDLTYAGRLGGDGSSRHTPQYLWIVHSRARREVYALTAGTETTSRSASASTPPRIDVHSEDFLQRERSLEVPCLDTKIGKQVVHGRYVFAEPTGTRLYVLGQLDPEAGAARDWVSAVISL